MTCNIPDVLVWEVVGLEDLLVLVGHSVGDNHDGLVAVGAHLRVGPARLEQLEGDGEGRGEVGDLLRRHVLHRLLVLPDVLVGRLHQLSLS